MKLAFLVFLFSTSIWGIGGVKFSLNPLSIHFGKPYQLIGIILIIAGVLFLQHQERVSLIDEITDYAESEIEKKIDNINPL